MKVYAIYVHTNIDKNSHMYHRELENHMQTNEKRKKNKLGWKRIVGLVTLANEMKRIQKSHNEMRNV